MHLISHRGNLIGPDPLSENNPDYVDAAIRAGFEVEIDIWRIGSKWLLGHDAPQYVVPWEFLIRPGLWIHAKNMEAMVELNKDQTLNYFWHEKDRATLTSRGFIWAYPGRPIENSIAAMPEQFRQYEAELGKCLGICSDYIKQYKPRTTP